MLTVKDQREEGIYDDSQNSHFHLCISSYDIQKVEHSPEEDEHFVFKEMTVKKKMVLSVPDMAKEKKAIKLGNLQSLH